MTLLLILKIGSLNSIKFENSESSFVPRHSTSLHTREELVTRIKSELMDHNQPYISSMADSTLVQQAL